MNLLLDVADVTGLPDDPEFRAAFAGYIGSSAAPAA
jgi:hypothetical protein